METLHLPLKVTDGRLLTELGGIWYLVDTGCPCSFGVAGEFGLLGDIFRIEDYYRDLNAAKLSSQLGVRLGGVIGMDLLGRFDLLFDPEAGWLHLSKGELNETGAIVPLDCYVGIPIVHLQFSGAILRCFLGSGQRLSYLQHPDLAGREIIGEEADFHLGHGIQRTPVHRVEVGTGECAFDLKVGYLTDLASTGLLLAATNGILGAEVFLGRRTGFFPRRELLVLGRSCCMDGQI